MGDCIGPRFEASFVVDHCNLMSSSWPQLGDSMDLYGSSWILNGSPFGFPGYGYATCETDAHAAMEMCVKEATVDTILAENLKASIIKNPRLLGIPHGDERFVETDAAAAAASVAVGVGVATVDHSEPAENSLEELKVLIETVQSHTKFTKEINNICKRILNHTKLMDAVASEDLWISQKYNDGLNDYQLASTLGIFLFEREIKTTLYEVFYKDGTKAEWDSDFTLGLAVVAPTGAVISIEEAARPLTMHFGGRPIQFKNSNVVYKGSSKDRTDKRIQARCYYRIRKSEGAEGGGSFVPIGNAGLGRADGSSSPVSTLTPITVGEEEIESPRPRKARKL